MTSVYAEAAAAVEESMRKEFAAQVESAEIRGRVEGSRLIRALRPPFLPSSRKRSLRWESKPLADPPPNLSDPSTFSTGGGGPRTCALPVFFVLGSLALKRQ
jgi:hypothetical protein